MREPDFRFSNDVGNRLELFNEGGFIGIHVTTSGTFSSLTMKKEDVKELFIWLKEYLGK